MLKFISLVLYISVVRTSTNLAVMFLNFFRQWGEATFHYIKSIIESDKMCAYQMTYITGYIVYDQLMPKVL